MSNSVAICCGYYMHVCVPLWASNVADPWPKSIRYALFHKGRYGCLCLTTTLISKRKLSTSPQHTHTLQYSLNYSGGVCVCDELITTATLRTPSHSPTESRPSYPRLCTSTCHGGLGAVRVVPRTVSAPGCMSRRLVVFRPAYGASPLYYLCRGDCCCTSCAPLSRLQPVGSHASGPTESGRRTRRHAGS